MRISLTACHSLLECDAACQIARYVKFDSRNPFSVDLKLSTKLAQESGATTI